MTDENRTPKAERDTRNRGLQEEQKRQQDPEKRTPHRAIEHEAPPLEQPTEAVEADEEDIAHLENPPQADGPRERNNDAV